MLWVLIIIASTVEAILISPNNIGFYEDLTNIIFELSSNTPLISSPVLMSRDLRKSVFGFPTRSDTNRAVQPQKMPRNMQYWI